MSDFQRPAEQVRRTAGFARGNLVATLVNLWPYIWPADRRDLKARVIFATVLLFLAKLATVAVPFTFKWATDALAGRGTAPIAPDNWLAWAFTAPIVMTLAYGGARGLVGRSTQTPSGDLATGATNTRRVRALRLYCNQCL